MSNGILLRDLRIGLRVLVRRNHSAHWPPSSWRSASPLNDDPPPDAIEKSIRFGCGALLGLLLGCSTIIDVQSAPAAIAVLTGAATVCGVLAVRFGDRFWYALPDFLWLLS